MREDSEMREGRGELEENRDLQQHQDKPPDPLISDLINTVQQQRGTFVFRSSSRLKSDRYCR